MRGKPRVQSALLAALVLATMGAPPAAAIVSGRPLALVIEAGPARLEARIDREGLRTALAFESPGFSRGF